VSTYDAIPESIYTALLSWSQSFRSTKRENPEYYYNPRTDVRRYLPLRLSTSTRPSWHDDVWYPSSENELVAELLTVENYRETEELVGSAKKRARRREAGDE
jgi:hypothetical protein